MKVVCDRAALNEALSISSSVIASRSPTPVLLCLKLVAHDGLLSIMSTDAEVGLSVNVAQVEVNQPGEALRSLLRWCVINSSSRTGDGNSVIGHLSDDGDTSDGDGAAIALVC